MKIFVKHIPNIGFVFKICKELLKLTNKKTDKPNKKISKRSE